MKHEATSLRTKQAFAGALKEIMCHKRFSKITVSEVVTACGVNRKTFYYHFEDLYDLLRWTLDAEVLEVVRQFDLPMDYEKAIRFVMEYAERNEFMIRCACDAVGRDGMRRFFYADFIEVIFGTLDRCSPGTTPQFKAFAARFYAEALAGVLIDWVQNRDRQDRETVAAYLCEIFGKNLTLMQ